MTGGTQGGNALRYLYTGVLDCLFPKYCLVCKQEGEYVCIKCLQDLPLTYHPRCFGCETPSVSGELCPTCQLTHAFDGVIIAGSYEDSALGTLIKTCKYRFVKDLSGSLGWSLCQKIERVLNSKKINSSLEKQFFQAVVTAVPLSKRRLREREFNQVDLIARVVADYFNLRYEEDWLGRQHRKPQNSLNEKQRQGNLAASFFLAKKIEDCPRLVLVVDDVITTGATLQEAARVLKTTGVEQVWGVKVAKG